MKYIPTHTCASIHITYKHIASGFIKVSLYMPFSYDRKPEYVNKIHSNMQHQVNFHISFKLSCHVCRFIFTGVKLITIKTQ